MQRSVPITNETEFQEWLARVLELDRQLLRDEAAARESQKQTSFKVVREK
jgi:hypothetical protein